MFRYDKDNDTLVISKIPVNKPEYVYADSPMYTQYEKYMNTKLLEDIDEFVIKPIDIVLSDYLGLDSVIQIARDGMGKVKGKIVEDYSNNAYHGYEVKTVFISIKIYGSIKETELFPILSIPAMDKYGIIHKDNRELALIATLVQSDDITFEKGSSREKDELKIITREGNYFNVKANSKSLYMTFGKRKVNIEQVIAALADRDGLNTEKILEVAASVLT